uniref:Heme-binding protein 1 n=1 Tax=Tetraodon nigroviridis TaxID=99883 RepID=H3C5Q8_TETNG
MGVGAAMAFRRLFQYISGANEAGLQMEMTAPVLVRIPEETKMWEPAVYTLNFLLPAAYQEKPPVPTNDKLYFTELPEMDAYVRSYGGWMLSVTSRLHAHLLAKELGRVSAAYNRSYHYGVGYDSPLKLLNRHNELWYVAEGQVICTDPQEPTPPHPPRTTAPPVDSDPELLSLRPSDPPSLAPSNLSPSAAVNASDAPPSGAPSSHPPTSTRIPLEASTNSSEPGSLSPSPQ